MVPDPIAPTWGFFVAGRTSLAVNGAGPPVAFYPPVGRRVPPILRDLRLADEHVPGVHDLVDLGYWGFP